MDEEKKKDRPFIVQPKSIIDSILLRLKGYKKIRGTFGDVYLDKSQLKKGRKP